MDVAIVVLAWEDIDQTQQCVRSMPAEAEVIVVDNGSSAPIREAIRQLCQQVGAKYVQTGSNLGYAKGMNAGAQHCTRGTIILANNDVIVHGGTVERLLRELEDPAVGVAFPKVVDLQGNEETAAGRFLSVRIGIGHAIGLSAVIPRLRIVATPEGADWLTGPFVAIRRETFAAIGGVDESSEFYSEDVRLCWAVHKLGLRVAYVPDAVINHLGDGSSKRRWSADEISRRQTREFIRANRELGGWRGWVASAAYATGVVWRAGVTRNAARRATARGAIEGMRSG
jgi:GT2 family glycosyltransferase